MSNFRVAIAQEIWKSIFPDRKHGICQKIFKICFYTGNLPSTQGTFRVGKKMRLLC